MSKRGVIILEALIKLAPVLILLLLFAVAVFVLLPALLGTNDQESRNSFQSITKTVENMLSNSAKFEYQELTVTMPADNVIKGFAPGQAMPAECSNKPCLCYYNKYQDINDARPAKCKSFHSLDFYSNVIFITTPNPATGFSDAEISRRMVVKSPVSAIPYPPRLRSDSTYYYLHLELKDELQADIPKFNTLYIEKFSDGSQGYVLITRIVTGRAMRSVIEASVPYEERRHLNIPVIEDTKGFTEEQKSVRISSFLTCPKDSEEGCAGSYVDERSPSGICILQNGKCVFKEATDCSLNELITADCFCGGTLTIKPDSGQLFCTRNSTRADIVLSYKCSDIASCSDYCKVSNNNAACDTSDERSECNINPCGLREGCSLSANFSRYNCVSKNTAS